MSRFGKEAKQHIIQVKFKVQDVPTDGGTLEEKAGTSSLVSRLILVNGSLGKTRSTDDPWTRICGTFGKVVDAALKEAPIRFSLLIETMGLF